MELPNYLRIISTLLAIVVVAMAMLGMSLRAAEARRAASTVARRWSGQRITQLMLGGALSVLLLAALAYPLVRHTYLQRLENASWRTVMPIGGHFSIEVPGRPEVSTARQPSAYGYMEQHAVTLYREHGLSFSATSSSIPSASNAADDPMAFMKKWRDKMLLDNHFQLLQSRDVKQNGLSGIEFACNQQTFGPMVFRCFCAKNRLYTLWVGPMKADERSAEAQRFFNSFKIE